MLLVKQKANEAMSNTSLSYSLCSKKLTSRSNSSSSSTGIEDGPVIGVVRPFWVVPKVLGARAIKDLMKIQLFESIMGGARRKPKDQDNHFHVYLQIPITIRKPNRLMKKTIVGTNYLMTDNDKYVRKTIVCMDYLMKEYVQSSDRMIKNWEEVIMNMVLGVATNTKFYTMDAINALIQSIKQSQDETKEKRDEINLLKPENFKDQQAVNLLQRKLNCEIMMYAVVTKYLKSTAIMLENKARIAVSDSK